MSRPNLPWGVIRLVFGSLRINFKNSQVFIVNQITKISQRVTLTNDAACCADDVQQCQVHPTARGAAARFLFVIVHNHTSFDGSRNVLSVKISGLGLHRHTTTHRRNYRKKGSTVPLQVSMSTRLLLIVTLAPLALLSYPRTPHGLGMHKTA